MIDYLLLNIIYINKAGKAAGKVKISSKKILKLSTYKIKGKSLNRENLLNLERGWIVETVSAYSEMPVF